jgi:hypothetical protein
MKSLPLGLLAVLVLGGCGTSAPETATPNGRSPVNKAMVPPETSGDQTVAAESAPPVVEAAPLVDAERLLASTLATAKAENKRVMVHLGAPW